jgi:putative FmdB family regulatory protein
MPLYEYRCHKCGKTFEVLQKFADKPLDVHEECGGEVERLISPPAFLFKGTGWYVTDYGRNGKSSAPASNGKSESKEGKSEGKSEAAKPEIKPPASTPSSASSER